MKKFIFALFILAAISVPSANAGVLRAIGHTGAGIGKGTAHFGKSLAHDVYRDFKEWIY